MKTSWRGLYQKLLVGNVTRKVACIARKNDWMKWLEMIGWNDWKKNWLLVGGSDHNSLNPLLSHFDIDHSYQRYLINIYKKTVATRILMTHTHFAILTKTKNSIRVQMVITDYSMIVHKISKLNRLLEYCCKRGARNLLWDSYKKFLTSHRLL